MRTAKRSDDRMLKVLLGTAAGLAASLAASSANAQYPAAQPTYAQPVQQGYPGGVAYGTPNQTTQRLDQGEAQNNGLGLEIAYAKVMGGLAIDSVGLLSHPDGGSSKTYAAPMVGLAAGMRFLTWTFGVRARLDALSDFDLWKLDLEAAYHPLVGRLDPYFGVHGGYDFGTNLGNTDAVSTSLHGFDLGVHGGADYYVTSLFSVGAEGTAEFLYLHDSTTVTQTITTGTGASSTGSVSASGSSSGLGFVAGVHAALHFDL